MIVLGIDPGLRDTGWGVVSYDERGHYKALSYGVIQTDTSNSLQKRIFTITEDLATVARRYGVTVVSMEDIFFTKNITSAIPVAKVIGAIIYKFSEMGLSVNLYAPREIKMAITGMGNAEKAQIQDMVKRFLNLADIPKPDHAADALADCICYCSHYSFKDKISL